MIHGLLTALGTSAGKVAAGVALTAAAAGGVVATDVVDLPSTEDSTIEVETEIIVEELEVDLSENGDGEEEAEKAEEVEGDEDADAIEADEEEYDNHGQQVSEFARTTELEGCEKGQAISALASSKADEKRQNEDKEDSPCKSDEVDDEEETRSLDDDEDHDDEDEEDDEDEDDDHDDDEDEEDGPGNGKGRGQGRNKK